MAIGLPGVVVVLPEAAVIAVPYLHVLLVVADCVGADIEPVALKEEIVEFVVLVESEETPFLVVYPDSEAVRVGYLRREVEFVGGYLDFLDLSFSYGYLFLEARVFQAPFEDFLGLGEDEDHPVELEYR